MTETIHIIGGGLAGSEAAWQAASTGAHIILHEMRPVRTTDAHSTEGLAELVCSNSLRSDDYENNAVGLLHEEMRRAGSLILACADAHRLPAGGALAVDRHGFSDAVTRALHEHQAIEIRREEIAEPPADWDNVMEFAWMQSRYDKGDGKDYINCPLEKDQYLAFIAALLAGEKTEFKEWEKSTPYFEGCLPIEVMASRGVDTLRYGPMKPVGLKDPRAEHRPYAVVQLRQDNALGTLWNIVGFQTKLKHADQVRIFRTIPGLQNAEFARLGGLHRNTFLNSPRLLDGELRLKARPALRFAGQVTGVEGYVESAAIGLLAGRFAAGKNAPPPPTTALGALLAHITGGAEAETFQPMNVNFGLFPELPPGPRGRERKKAHSTRALADLAAWLNPAA
jgi:methylenetetrahydrofolate--tRNA-(uracil-5-)-methyltransferase